MKGQRIEIFKNLKHIFLINNQHSLKSYQLGNIENFSKEVFFRLTTFFFRNKKILSKKQLLFSFLSIVKQKKIRSDPNIFEFFKKYFFQTFSDRSKFFFCFTTHKKLNKSCSLDKIFLFLKKKLLV